MNKICAVILAAGVSRRLGFSKLFVRIDGETVIRRSVRPFLSERLTKVYVVVGEEIRRFQDELQDLPVEIIPNPYFMQGMSASVKASVPFLSDFTAALFHLGDKPLLEKSIVDSILDVYEKEEANLVVPRCRGRLGHPVLIHTAPYLREMTNLQGDRGLREVIEKHREDVVFIEGDETILFDIDTMEQIEELRSRGLKVEES
jgi:molybdenum cofactor cytidylyltransferase